MSWYLKFGQRKTINKEYWGTISMKICKKSNRWVCRRGSPMAQLKIEYLLKDACFILIIYFCNRNSYYQQRPLLIAKRVTKIKFFYKNLCGEKISDDMFSCFLFRKRNVQTLDKSSSCSLVKILRSIGRTNNQNFLVTGTCGAILNGHNWFNKNLP